MNTPTNDESTLDSECRAVWPPEPLFTADWGNRMLASMAKAQAAGSPKAPAVEPNPNGHAYGCECSECMAFYQRLKR